jgi:hypothetical protein
MAKAAEGCGGQAPACNSPRNTVAPKSGIPPRRIYLQEERGSGHGCCKSINTTGEMVPSPRTTYPSPARPRQEPRRGQHHGTETAAGTRTQEHNGTSRSASGGTPRPAPAGQAAGARHRARAGQAAHAHKPPASRGRARGPRGCNHRARWVVETNLAPVPLHGTFSNTSISTAMENTSISTAL